MKAPRRRAQDRACSRSDPGPIGRSPRHRAAGVACIPIFRHSSLLSFAGPSRTVRQRHREQHLSKLALWSAAVLGPLRVRGLALKKGKGAATCRASVSTCNPFGQGMPCRITDTHMPCQARGPTLSPVLAAYAACRPPGPARDAAPERQDLPSAAANAHFSARIRPLLARCNGAIFSNFSYIIPPSV